MTWNPNRSREWIVNPEATQGLGEAALLLADQEPGVQKPDAIGVQTHVGAPVSELEAGSVADRLALQAMVDGGFSDGSVDAAEGILGGDHATFEQVRAALTWTTTQLQKGAE